jgi:multidrug efflux system membrane fusion protein
MPCATPISLLATLTAAAFLGGCGAHDAPPAATPTVMVQAASRAPAGGSIYSGEIRARYEFDVAFRVGGKIAARLVDAGAQVKAGQALAQLDPADLELNASSTRAQLAAAESDFATARAERERYAGLVKQKFVSAAAFEAKDNAFNSTRARLAQAQAQNKISGNQASYGTLSSDKPAIVTAVLADAGQVVSAGQAVMRLARPEEKEVSIAVPESRLAALKPGQIVTVNLWADPKIIVQGKVREIAPAADTATRTFLVRINLTNPPPDIQIGMTARVAIGDSLATPLLVPLSAVSDRGQGPQLWLVQDGKATPRAVQVAQFREDGATIASGLTEGEIVIISGLNRLTPGMAVTPRPAATPEQQR